MKRVVTFLSLMLSITGCIIFFSFATPAATPPAKAETDYQRYITFHNDFKFPIYPVVQVPADICDGSEDKTVRRIIVNGAGHDGLTPNEILTVLIPNEQQNITVNGVSQVASCWYQSGRVYILPVKLSDFEKNMVAVQPSNQAQTTQYPPPGEKHPSVAVTCFQGKRDNQGKGANGNCMTGVADNSFAADVPAQLAEYTFDSDFRDTNGDPDTGIPMADIDVSHVDDLYLPVAASVVNHGATGYMGAAMDFSTFQQRISSFFTKAPWTIYSAYLSQNQNQGKNALFGLLPPQLVGGASTPSPHLPAGFNSIQNTLSKPMSSVYKMEDGSQGYLISGVTNQDSQVQPYLERWRWWVNQNGQPCSTSVMNQLVWPDGITSTFNKQNFCNQFSATVNAVWTHFLTDSQDGFQSNQAQFYADCGLTNTNPDPDSINACIIQHIVGYNSKIEGGKLPGQVQALLRGVAYDPTDGNPQYQYDPFLTFAAPYNSQFNLNPFTRLIHSKTDGIGAVAYSFSIDDKYGNFRDASSGIIVDAGGTSALDNQQPYDPYQQYTVNWGYNRDPFSLVLVQSGVKLATIQTQLQSIAQQNQNRPFLIKRDQNLSVFGHDSGNSWKLTQSLVTLDQLQVLAKQEYDSTNGATHYYQDLIDYTFGTKSIFPTSPLNVNAVNSQDIGLLDFDQPSDWGEGQALLYGFITQQNADMSVKGNWTSATVCGLPITIARPGAQRLPLQFANGVYQPCTISMTDTYNETLTFTLTPEFKQVTDNYTGAQVSVWSLPIGDQFSGSPLIASSLKDSDLQTCLQNSSSGRVSGLCNNVTLSAVWSGDPLSRDVVYMGLDPKNMPRVNVNLPPAPSEPVDPNVVSWPSNAAITFQPQNNEMVRVRWSTAVAGSNKPLKYLLYVQDGANWNLQQQCDQSQTYCDVKASSSLRVYVIAQNNAVQPPFQTPQLFGCYPSENPCPPTTQNRRKPR